MGSAMNVVRQAANVATMGASDKLIFKKVEEQKRKEAEMNARMNEANANAAANAQTEKDDAEARRRAMANMNTTGPMGLSGGQNVGRRTLLGN